MGPTKTSERFNISCGVFYHIYNRGINGESLFKESRNYSYFLQQYAKYMPSVVETYAYCLMNNHFHLLIKTRSAEEVFQNTKHLHKIGSTLSPADHTHLSKLDTKLRRVELLDWFGDTDQYKKYHLANHVLTDLEKFEIDFDAL